MDNETNKRPFECVENECESECKESCKRVKLSHEDEETETPKATEATAGTDLQTNQVEATQAASEEPLVSTQELSDVEEDHPNDKQSSTKISDQPDQQDESEESTKQYDPETSVPDENESNQPNQEESNPTACPSLTETTETTKTAENAETPNTDDHSEPPASYSPEVDA